MAFPLLLVPLITSALGAGIQAARGKTDNKSLKRGMMLGAGTGLGGAGLASAAGWGSMLGGAGAAGTGGATAAELAAAGASPALTTALTTSAPAAAGVNSYLTGLGQTMATQGITGGLASAMTPEQRSEFKQPVGIPELQQAVDPWAFLQQIQSMGGKS